MREQVMALVRAHFRPEFLNRVDDIVVFARSGCRSTRKHATGWRPRAGIPPMARARSSG